MLGALKGGSVDKYRANLTAWREALSCEALGRDADAGTADKTHSFNDAFE